MLVFIENALNYLDNANFAGYFEYIDKVSLPNSLRTPYANHKAVFMTGQAPFNFDQQLRVFARELKYIFEKDNLIEQECTNNTIKEFQNTEDVPLLLDLNVIGNILFRNQNNNKYNNNLKLSKLAFSQGILVKSHFNFFAKNKIIEKDYDYKFRWQYCGDFDIFNPLIEQDYIAEWSNLGITHYIDSICITSENGLNVFPLMSFDWFWNNERTKKVLDNIEKHIEPIFGINNYLNRTYGLDNFLNLRYIFGAINTNEGIYTGSPSNDTIYFLYEPINEHK